MVGLLVGNIVGSLVELGSMVGAIPIQGVCVVEGAAIRLVLWLVSIDTTCKASIQFSIFPQNFSINPALSPLVFMVVLVVLIPRLDNRKDKTRIRFNTPVRFMLLSLPEHPPP
jgi:hypothetical protein